MDPKALEELKDIVGEGRVSTGYSVRGLHSRDESFHRAVLPDVVVWPHSTEEVGLLVRWAYRHKVPVTPWGAGTSLEGNPIPVKGGLVVDLQEMNKVIRIRPEDFQVDVQAGVVYKELNRELARYGLFFPPDPGAAATIGGMIGNNASGIRTVKYGPTRDYILRLTVVLPTGEVVEVGNRARKTSSGYDLLRLFCGAEGTLGIVTEATLRLVGLPQCFMAVRATFATVSDATHAVFQVMRSGLQPSAMEFLDAEVVKVLNRDRGLELEEAPTLLMEFDGYSAEGLEQEMAFVEEICRENRCLLVDKGLGPEEMNRLWEVRHLTFESIKRSHPGLEPLIMDVAVPLSRYSEMVAFVKGEVSDLTAYVFGHAGDGNVHVVVMDDPTDPQRWRRVQEANRKVVLKALELEGTCTGEHGVGIGKREFALREHGEAIRIMRRIKELLDPEGLMNPGKIFL